MYRFKRVLKLIDKFSDNGIVRFIEIVDYCKDNDWALFNWLMSCHDNNLKEQAILDEVIHHIEMVNIKKYGIKTF